MKKFLSFAAVALMAMSAVSFVSCSSDDDNNNSDTPAQVKYTSSKVSDKKMAMGMQIYFGTRLGGTADSICQSKDSNQVVIYAKESKKTAVEKILSSIQTETALQKCIHDQNVMESFSFTFSKEGDASTTYSYSYSFPFTGVWGCVVNNVTYTYICKGYNTKGSTFTVHDPNDPEGSFTEEGIVGRNGGILVSGYALMSVSLNEDLKSFTCKIVKGSKDPVYIDAEFVKQ